MSATPETQKPAAALTDDGHSPETVFREPPLATAVNRKLTRFSTVQDRTGEVVTVLQMVEELRSERHRRTVEQIRRETDKAKRDRLKKTLPAFAVAGEFQGGHGAVNLRQRSGLLVLDIDSQDNPEIDRSTVEQDGNTLCAFASPSGGLKAVCLVDPEADHRRAFQCLSDHFELSYGLVVDPSGKDVGRLCFASWDPSLHLNPSATPLHLSQSWDPEPEPPEEFDLSQVAETVGVTAEQARENLRRLNSDCSRADWLKVACALRHEFQMDPETGFELFHSWSEGADNYKGEADCRRTWESLKPNPTDRKPTTYATILQMIQRLQVESWEAFRWDPLNPPERKPPLFLFDSRVPLRRGNLSVISGKSGIGKTSFRDGLIASTGCIEGADCLGWTCEGRQGAVILFDYEQSNEDFADGCRRIWQRAGTAPPPWFYAYRFRDLQLKDRKEATHQAIAKAFEEQGGIDLICLDGGTDLVADANSSEESPVAVTDWLELSSRYDCNLNAVIHTNEAQAAGKDARGHLGKEATRKAEAVLYLEKLDPDTTAVSTTKNRKAGIDRFLFRWSDERRMHVTAEAGEDPKEKEKREGLESLALQVAEGKTLNVFSYSDLCRKIIEALGCAKSTAERRIKDLKRAGIVQMDRKTGKWRLEVEPSREAIGAEPASIKGFE